MGLRLRHYLDLLTSYLRPQRLRVFLLALVLCGDIGLQLVNPQILRDFIDIATQKGAFADLTRLALLFTAVALLGQVLAVALTYLSENIGWTATNALRADLAAHCLRLDLAFHKARTPGELIERVDGDVNELSNFFAQFVVNLLGNLLLMAGVLVLLFREDWRVGLALGLFAISSIAILIRIRSFATPYWDAVREQSAQFYGFVGEQLAGTEDVRSSGATGYVMHRFHELMRRWLPLTRRANLAGYAMWTTTLGLFAIGNAIAFGLGTYLLGTGAITIGTVYLIFYYTELLRQPIEQLRTQLQDLQRADASIMRVARLFATQPTIVDGVGTPLPAGALGIAFDHVSFGYADGQGSGELQNGTIHSVRVIGENLHPETEIMGDVEMRPDAEVAPPPSSVPRPNLDMVLHDLSFALKPGKVLGVLGRTGSGKTTIARLLLRLYDPLAGEVLLGGVPLRATTLRDLRRQVGVVTQEVQLFNATLRDNLTFFDNTISDIRMIAVLHDLGMARWFAALPAGLDTELAAGGALSAGEAQLLAFARLFLADPGLVILDEASSRLDPATEQLIEHAVTRLLQGRTGVIIAHRLATVQRADEILVLEHGRILEHGARAALADDPDSHFSQLLRTGLEEVLA